MVTYDDVLRAAEAVEDVARETPVLPAKRLARQVRGECWLKLQNLKMTGCFKVRGRVNRLSAMSAAERDAGVLAASAGNHAQAVAWAARKLGTKATLFMPAEAPLAKIAAVHEYGGGGGRVDGGFDDAVTAAREAAATAGRVIVHAFDDPVVIAG